MLSRCSEHHRHHKLHRDVSAHVVDALMTVVGRDFYILQSAEMALIGAVEEVGAAEIEAGTLHAMNLQIGAGKDVEQRVRRCCRLRAVERIEMVLTEVTFRLQGYVSVVQYVAVADEVVAQITRKARSWCPRQILALARLMELHTVNVRKRVLEVETVDGVEVDTCLTSEHACIALMILISVITLRLYTR